MQLTMMGEYALRAMMFMAEQPPAAKVQITEISRSWQIPENFLRKIIPQLSRAGLIYSQRGSGGGVSLLQSADKITALDVIEAVEGKLFLNKCLIHDGFCDRTEWCAMHSLWAEAQDKLREILNSRTLTQLVEESRSKIDDHKSLK